MKLSILFFVLLAVFVITACEEGPIGPEVAGLQLGMSRDQVHTLLQGKGELEKQSSKQQEVWRLTSNDSFSHVMVGYDKELRSARFVTAVAKGDGHRVAYSDVIDTNRATRADSGDNVAYMLESGGGDEAFLIRAMGTDPQYLEYYSVKRTGEDEEDDE